MSLSAKNYQIRGLVILLVIIGHAISTSLNFTSLKLLYVFIYSFHIPLLMIISGFYSNSSVKRSFLDNLKINFKSFLLPYLIINSLYFILFNDNGLYNYIQFSGFGTWFLLCLFVYKMLIKYVNKVPYILIILVLINIFSAIIPSEIGNYFQLQRICGFGIYFYLGYYIFKTNFNIEVKFQKWILYIVTIVIGIANLISYNILGSAYISIFYLANSLSTTQFNLGTICFVKLVQLTTSIFISFLVYTMVKKPHKFLYYIGINSMVFYVANLFIIKAYRLLVPSAVFDLLNFPTTIVLCLLVVVSNLLIATWFVQLKKFFWEI